MAEVEAVPVATNRPKLQWVDLARVTFDPAVAALLPASVASRHHVVPIGRKFGAPVVAMADAEDVVAVDTLRATFGRDFIAVLADAHQIGEAIERLYSVSGPASASPPPATTISTPPASEAPASSAVVDPAPTSAASGTAATADPTAGPKAGAPQASALPAPEQAGPDRPAQPARESREEVFSEALADIHATHPRDEDDELSVHGAGHGDEPGGGIGGSGSAGATSADPSNIAGFPPLARVLVEGERVSLEAMHEVLEERDRTGQAIARILTTRGLVTEADLMWGMAQEMGLEFVDLDLRSVDSATVYSLPEATARHHNVLIVGTTEDGVPEVAASNPTDVFAMDDLRTLLGRNFVTVVATRSQINTYIDKAYNHGGDASEVANTAASDFDEVEEDLSNLQAVVDDAPIVRYVNLLILQALNERASDIHVEPTAENLRIRYRIDGVLHDVSTAPRNICGAVTTRLKVMAELNIAEHRIPQDGRISLTVGNRQVDLRMATLPTIYGEKIVMRVLDKSNVVLGFEDLGFDDDLLEKYRHVFSKPYGTILVTGPTGSGKTTTLYATLSALNAPDRNIITVEDPVELRIKGINQVQLNVKAGLTFASALRSILRADPDILLVGEIRDRETALISVEAALTGHLVLATLHTNDAASTPMRLVEMGLEPYLVTSALSGVVAQRLARSLCVHCKEPYEPTEAEVAAAGWGPEEVFGKVEHPIFHRAVGCQACSKTGYRGRKALLEFLVVSDEVERMIIEGGTADDIHTLAVAQGMVTLRESGLRKDIEGETTLEEVLRVVA